MIKEFKCNLIILKSMASCMDPYNLNSLYQKGFQGFQWEPLIEAKKALFQSMYKWMFNIKYQMYSQF